MSQFEDYVRQGGYDALVQAPVSSGDLGLSSYGNLSGSTAGGSQFERYLGQQGLGGGLTESGFAGQGENSLSYGASLAGSSQFERYIQGRGQPRGGQDTTVLPRDWYIEPQRQRLGGGTVWDFTRGPAGRVDTLPRTPGYRPYQPYQPYIRPQPREERWYERPGVRRVALVAGAAALAVTAVATALVGTRGHVEAHQAPQQPVAAGKAHPFKWLPIYRNGTINMANAAKDAAHVPDAVLKTKGGVEEILNYNNPDSNGRIDGFAGTGYVENIGGHNWLVTAGHCVAGTPDQMPYPNYIVETNVGDQGRKNIVLGFQVPKSFNRNTDTFIDSPSDDLAIVGVMPVDWWDSGGFHKGDNGWNELPALKNATNKPGVGSLVFTYGYRPPQGEEIEPPQGPLLQAMVVVGYNDDGSRMVLLPVDTQRPSDQQEGNSGAAIENKFGRVVSTLIAGGSETQQWFQNVYHVKIIGGDGAQIDPGQINFEVATVNSPRNFRQASTASPVEPGVPAHIPA